MVSPEVGAALVSLVSTTEIRMRVCLPKDANPYPELIADPERIYCAARRWRSRPNVNQFSI
jgi:hypothetical protein